MSILSSYLEESMEEAMQPYTSSDEYKKPNETINSKINAFRNTLTEDQKKVFNSLLNDMNDAHAAFATKAYVTGAVNGIALREEVLHPVE